MKFFIAWLTILFSLNVSAKPDSPHLILVVVFDQMRADYLTRFESRFLPARAKDGHVGGFKYLMDKGAYFPLAEHGPLQNMTCVGHAAILTGAYPYQNGIALNEWFDDDKQKHVYCVEDESHHVVGATPKDPHPGTSPVSLVGTTFGDELKNAGLKSRVIALSLKDRAAILLGGHRADLALWLDSDSFHWVSSDYYVSQPRLPDWVQTLNQKLDREKGRTLTWTIQGDGTGRSTNEMITLVPKKGSSLSPHFPHGAVAGSEDSLLFPYGVEITEAAAEGAIGGLHLGRGSDPDVLAVSYSTHDLTGHTFGPNSREMEEMTVSEDRSLSQLFNYIEKNVPGGLKKTLIVMTADHGVAPNPDWLEKENVPAGRIEQKTIRAAINDFLDEKYKKPTVGEWVSDIYELNVYFNRQALAERKLRLQEVEKTVSEFVLGSKTLMAGVAHVFTGADVEARTLPPEEWEKQILRTYVRGRSGDVIFIPKPNYVIGRQAATHLSGYTYDRMVPLAFVGDGIKPGRHAEMPQVIDIAPTLSYITGVIPPSGSTGRILSEVLQ